MACKRGFERHRFVNTFGQPTELCIRCGITKDPRARLPEGKPKEEF